MALLGHLQMKMIEERQEKMETVDQVIQTDQLMMMRTVVMRRHKLKK